MIVQTVVPRHLLQADLPTCRCALIKHITLPAYPDAVLCMTVSSVLSKRMGMSVVHKGGKVWEVPFKSMHECVSGPELRPNQHQWPVAPNSIPLLASQLI